MSASYLDHCSTTPIDPRVQREVVRCFQELYANASSPHELGRHSKEQVHRSRDVIAAVVSARKHEVIFTSGATESNNLAILGLAPYAQQTNKKHIVTTSIEHKSVLEPLRELARQGFEITRIDAEPSGRIPVQMIVDAVREDTILVSLMHVNNETGVIQPVHSLADALCERKGVFLHVDAAQGFAKEAEQIDHPRIDLLSVSSHKLNGPLGVGALIARKRGSEVIPLSPLMFGGGQELGLRPGTLPVALISGFALAVQLAQEERERRSAHCQKLREIVLEKLAILRPIVHGAPETTLPHVLCASFAGLDAERVIDELSDIAAISTGSACTSICATSSHVLNSMGVPASDSDSAVRISWSHVTDQAELIETLDRIVFKLNRLK
ncbi:Cysteine desulfurase [Novipirellula aureliae]|uniref:cysteine desulfurase n=1 Tax=Novipirellula aureliae TaxID=2527966 RepID=A0A5C6EAT1_9BACT|nr:aminotransferase class V-fold PLP-dependent enzyme [Novipirellula aureliae]TWU45988.1 Cysteine desulfurase [Novipirellula aureliae]